MIPTTMVIRHGSSWTRWLNSMASTLSHGPTSGRGAMNAGETVPSNWPLQFGRARRSLRSLSRPPLNGSIVGQTESMGISEAVESLASALAAHVRRAAVKDPILVVYPAEISTMPLWRDMGALDQ